MELLAERLREIRIRNHYTVEDVANFIGVSKQAVSKYETGKAFPSSDVLEKIIKLYGLPVGYLTKKDMVVQECSELFYRRCQRTPQRELEDASILIKWCHLLILACEKRGSLHAPDFPDFEENLSIEENAKRLRMYWGIGDKPITDMAEELMSHGIHIFTTELENDKIDGYSRLIGEYPIIVLNQNKGSLVRKNYTLAHELGHLILHSKKDSVCRLQQEEEANCFAAEFLMPAQELKREIIYVDIDTLIKQGEKWHVSPQAVLERSQRLGFLEAEEDIKKAHIQYLLQKINKIKNYYIPEEEPICSIGNVLKEIDADEEMTEEFLKEVCLPIAMIRKICEMPTLFEKWEELPDSADEIEGVQLTFAF